MESCHISLPDIPHHPHLCQHSALFTTEELMLLHFCQPKPTADMRVHLLYTLWVWTMGLWVCSMTYAHHYNIIPSILSILKIIYASPTYVSLCPQPLRTTDLFTGLHCSVVFRMFYALDWLLSLDNVYLRSPLAIPYLDNLFLYSTNNIHHSDENFFNRKPAHSYCIRFSTCILTRSSSDEWHIWAT